MRIIFASVAMPTHFFSQVPLAWALRAAGHEVRIASQPQLTDSIVAAGLTAVPVGDDHTVLDAMVGTRDDGTPFIVTDFDPVRPEVHTWDFLRRAQAALCEKFVIPANNDTMLDELVRFARFWRPDLVIWEPFTVAGAVAAEAVGAAHARMLWGADLFLDQRTHFLGERALRPADEWEDPMAEWLGGMLDRHGLTFDERMLRGNWTIDSMPASIQIPSGEHTLPIRYIPYNGPAVVPDWLREPAVRPRVCVTIGITGRSAQYLDVSLANLFDAVADLDVEIVATLSPAQREQIPELPDNVRAVDFVPMHVLLQTCSVVAHHGGAGTWSTACSLGVPQLLFPSVWDDCYRARRTAEAGAGLLVSPGELTPEAFRDNLRRLLDEPSFAGAADRLRREVLADPAPSEVVGMLEKLTFECQGPVGE